MYIEPNADQAPILAMLMDAEEPTYEYFKRETAQIKRAKIVDTIRKEKKLPWITCTGMLYLAALINTVEEARLAIVETLEKADQMRHDVIDAEFIGTCVYPYGFYTNRVFFKVYKEKAHAPGKYSHVFNPR